MRQDEALTILKTGVNVFLTGEPGSGKTHTINRYIAYLRERGIHVSVTASTGIAATHVNGMTIHSWSGIGVKDELSDWDIEGILSREKTVRRILDTKVLVIDEISMLDATILDSVDRVVRAVRKDQRPFGGMQIIFVGDFFQLPPVSRGRAARFAFESSAWEASNTIICYIHEQHRQEDEGFLEILTALRAAQFTDDLLARLRSRIGIESRAKVPTRLYTHNVDVDRENDSALESIKSSGRRYEMLSSGASALVETLKKSCLSPENLTLKVGAAVMFTRNNFEVGYVNGTLGTVENFSVSGVPVVKTLSGRSIAAEPQEWSIVDGTRVLAKVTQVPLRLAWAITVHKSQGMSLESVIIDLGSAFEYGQGYVALSRVRTLDGLYLRGLNARALQTHPRVVASDERFRDASEAAAFKFESLSKDEVQKLHSNFVRAAGGKEPSTDRPSNPKGVGAMAILREKFPNAGRAWNTADDAKLREMFKAKHSMKEMGAHFGRKASAIRARLGHLGLIDDFWAKRKKTRPTS